VDQERPGRPAKCGQPTPGGHNPRPKTRRRAQRLRTGARNAKNARKSPIPGASTLEHAPICGVLSATAFRFANPVPEVGVGTPSGLQAPYASLTRPALSTSASGRVHSSYTCRTCLVQGGASVISQRSQPSTLDPQLRPKAWFCVEAATCPLTARSLRNSSTLSVPGNSSSRERIP
jgi:hypothetical protein